MIFIFCFNKLHRTVHIFQNVQNSFVHCISVINENLLNNKKYQINNIKKIIILIKTN